VKGGAVEFEIGLVGCPWDLGHVVADVVESSSGDAARAFIDLVPDVARSADEVRVLRFLNA